MNVTIIALLWYLVRLLIMSILLISCSYIPKYSYSDVSYKQMMPSSLPNVFHPLPVEYHFDPNWANNEYSRQTDYLSPIVHYSNHNK